MLKTPLGILILLPSLGVQDGDAEKLFQSSAKALAEAKSLSCDLTLKFETEGAGGNGELKGYLRFRPDNRIRLILEGAFNGRPMKSSVVCNGKKARIADPRGQADHEASENFSSLVLANAGRSGFFMGLRQMFRGPDTADFSGKKAGDFSSLEKFSMGAKEKVGDRDTRAISYSLTVPWMKNLPAVVTVWIDAESRLPLKLVMKVANRPGAPTTMLTETYGNWKRNGDIDDAEFKLEGE